MARPAMIAVVLLLLAAAGGWWWQNRAPPPVQWQGYAEADFVKVGPTQQGLLTTLAVRRGSKVTPGAALFDTLLLPAVQRRETKKKRSTP